MAFLRHQPYIQQLRQAIQDNPTLLHAVLQEIGNSNPQLLQVISQNQDAFIRLLNEPVSQGGSAPPSATEQAQGGDPAFGGVVHVTPQDKESIDRVSYILFVPETIFFKKSLVPVSGLGLGLKFGMDALWRFATLPNISFLP